MSQRTRAKSARRPSPVPTGRSRRRRLIAGVAAAVVVVAVAGVLVGLQAARGSTTPRPILTRPASYQIVYRVTTQTTGHDIGTWEVLTVHRPFDSSDVVYNSDPAVAPSTPQSATWFDVDTLYTLDGTGTVRRVAGRQPGPSGSDQALGVELDGLAKRKLARDLGRSMSVAGTTCHVYRFLEPPVGPIKPLSGKDHDDLCIDGNGLVLAERWVLHGRPAYERTAIRVRIGKVADPMTPAGAKPLPGAGATATATPGTDPEAPIAAPPTPAGYQAVRPELFTLPAPDGSGVAARSTVWAFTRGADAITVEAGFERGGHLPWDGQQTATTTVDLGRLGRATTALRSDGPEVRVPLGPGRWLRVRGTVPLADLVSYARRLTAAR